jgi:hypothetical protein
MMRSRAARSGQTLVMFALVLALVLVTLLAVVVNLAAVLDRYDQAALAAGLGAQAGAAAVDTHTYYTKGTRSLIQDQAQRQCETAANQTSGLGVTCTVAGDHITVTAQENVPLPLALGTTSVPISVTRSATGVFGGRRPLPGGSS